MGYAPAMACPRCGSETRHGQKFCAECGLALSTVCPSCGTPYEGSPKFCAECGNALPAAPTATTGDRDSGTGGRPSAPAAERRFVSVLFADLVGFTTLSEEEDPEAVRDLLSRYFDVAREVIENYGGTIEKFIGDAVMAVWGAPVAREDDAERAVRAALELVDRIGELALNGQSLTVRAGVLSGEAAVTVGRVGEGMVAGDIVNTASRLQSVAPAGVVLVGESTQQITSAAIAYEAVGDQALKGKTSPVAAWRALRVVARVGGEGREDGLEPPFVGRDEELRLLKDQLHVADRESKLRLVAITGQAGMGKSRLAWELEKYLDGLAGPQLYYWHHGRSPSYGEGVTYWALGEMIRRRARIAESDDAATTRDKLRATLDEFVPDAEERRSLEPALGALLGIDEADWDARERLFSAWRTFFERIADRGPSVLVFEDVQWADSGLLDFIDHLLDWARERPILVVALARPEIHERRPGFGVGRRAVVSMHLEPLSDESMRSLLRGLVPELADSELAQVVARAEGVPLFAVETVRSLVDAGHLVRAGSAYRLVGDLPTLDIPPTLRALIASRLDALEAADRALLQDASVLGVVFGVPALAGLAGRPAEEIERRLRALATKELVTLETDPRSPERGQYRFVQGLIREVAYGTLGRRERRQRHLAAAHYLEAIDDDELAGIRAAHYVEAFRSTPEGEEGAAIAAQARVALRAAADRATRLHSPEQALAYIDQALTVTFDEADAMELRIEGARAAQAVGRIEKAETYLSAAMNWQTEQGDVVAAADIAGQLAAIYLYGSRVAEALALLKRVLEILPGGPDSDSAAVRLNGELARALMFNDDPVPALAAVDRALQLAEKRPGSRQTLQLLLTKSWALHHLRRPRESTALIRGAMAMADDEDSLRARTRARFNLSSQAAPDDPHFGLRVAREGMAIAEQYGGSAIAANIAGNVASNAMLTGDHDLILSIEAGLTDLRVPLSFGIRGMAAVVAAFRGDRDGAESRMASVEEALTGSTSAQDVSGVRHFQALVAFGEGRLWDTQELSREVRSLYSGPDAQITSVFAMHAAVLGGERDGLAEQLEILRPEAIRGAWIARSVRSGEAALAAFDGRSDEAAADYGRVIEEWREARLPLDLALVLLERARLLGETHDEARAGRDEARALLEGIGAVGLLERLEGGGHQPPRSAVPMRKQTLPEDAAAARP